MNKIATKIDRVLETVPASLKLAFPPVYLYGKIRQDEEKKKDSVSLESSTDLAGNLTVQIIVYAVIVLVCLFIYFRRGRFLTEANYARSGWRNAGAFGTIIFAGPTYLFYALITAIFCTSVYPPTCAPKT